MYVIGERINGMFTDVKKAVRKKKGDVIKDLAQRQIKAGADALDVNVGPASRDVVGAMLWMCEKIRAVTDVPLVIDNAKLSVIKEVVPQVKPPVIINSTKADPESLAEYVPFAVEHNAGLVALTIDASGVPDSAEGRVEMAANILALSADGGLEPDKLFIDPIILPVNVAARQCRNVLEALKQINDFSAGACHLVLGLSNVSQNCARRELINRTYLAMAIGAGLDAAIMDPMDTELMEAAITAEVLLEKMVYCDSYVEAYHMAHGGGG